MRRTSIRTLTVLASLAVLLVASPAFADVGFRVEGSGWGHGIGMTQYGAYGQAKEGHSAGQIIRHYYRGAAPGQLPSSASPLLVGLHQHAERFSFVARGGDAEIRFGDGGSTMAHGGRRYQFRQANGGCELRRLEGDGSWTKLESSTVCHGGIFPRQGTRIDVSSKAYDISRGPVFVRPDANSSRFHVVAQLGLEDYMYGLAEVPYSWPVAALRAQVIAARSYAAFSVLSRGGSSGPSQTRREQCWCHVYDDTRDQVYAGWDREKEWNWDRWAAAVNGTSNLGVLAPGEPGTIQGVVQAFYSSSSGGRTENVDEAWGTRALPYLSSVADPWSLDSANPNAYWTINLSESAVRSRLASNSIHFDSVSTISVTSRNESGAAGDVVIRGRRNGQAQAVSISGSEARRYLGLRSAYIRRIFLPPFVDDDGSTFERDIVWIAERGITQGCNPPANDRFCPKEKVSRAEMAAFLVRAENLTQTSSGGWFRDVPRDSTFARDINKLATAGITKGCNPPANDRFCPKEAVSRAEMAAFLHRALD